MFRFLWNNCNDLIQTIKFVYRMAGLLFCFILFCFHLVKEFVYLEQILNLIVLSLSQSTDRQRAVSTAFSGPCLEGCRAG